MLIGFRCLRVCVRVDILVRCRPCMTPSIELPKMTQKGTNPIWVGRE